MADEWSAPTAQDYAGPAQDGLTRLMARIERLEQQLNELRSNTLKTAGLSIEPGTLRVLQNFAVDGEADFSGDTTIGGNLAVTGTLSLPAGIIDNDALATPVTSRSNYGNEGTFEINTTPTSRASYTVTVPAGFTKAFVIADAFLQAFNTTASSQYAYVRAYVTGPGGINMFSARSMMTLPAGFAGTITADLSREIVPPLNGGDVLTCFCEVNSSATIPTHASNYASGEALFIFTR